MSQANDPDGKAPKIPPYLHGSLLTIAVGAAFLDNVAKEAGTPDRPKASAEAWTTHSSYRTELFRRTLEFWSKASGFRSTDFPYSQDGVCREYLRFRKRNFDDATALKAAAEVEWANARASG